MRSLARVALVAFIVTVVLSSMSAIAGQQPPNRATSAPSAVERGRYLVTVQDCNGCHTPFKNGEPDLTRMLMGHPQDLKIASGPRLPTGWATAINDTNTAWSGPWGVSFTTNLTPDRVTGIGNWAEAAFVATIRNGKHFGGGRAILPPMPWQMYAKLTDDDLKAVFAYLRTIPPISNRVPDPIPPAKPAAGAK